MELKIPFLQKKKKKEKTSEDLRKEIHHLEYELDKKTGVTSGGDPVQSRLRKYGFVNAKNPVKGDLIKAGELKADDADQESFEKFQHRIVPTEFPDPARRFRLVLEYPEFNIEQTYYWFLRYFNESWGFERVDKVIDTHASSVASSTFGNMQTRLGAQQGQASQYLKGISDMIKGLFQMVRELRIIDERLQYYYDSDGDKKGFPENALSSEIVLKGLWVDQVEGGSKNPGSIYGLSATMGFTILPDLFFRIQIKDRKSLEKEVDAIKFNEKIKEVLKRKLRQYYEWKWRTKKELEVRRDFEIKYFKQHYDTIKMYMAWVKPYLRNARRLQLYEKNMERAEIINAFESQIIELELLFIRDDFGAGGKQGHSAAVVSMHLFFRVKPELSFHSYEYQHKGPIYAGMADITLRAYAWDHEQIENYKKYRQDDEIDLMSAIDGSVEAAMNALGDDLKKYLKEADPTLHFPGDEEEHYKHEKEGMKLPDVLDPFVSIFRVFGDIAKGFTGSPAKKEKKDDHDGGHGHKKPDAKEAFKHHKIHHRAEHFAVEACFEGYMRYKMGPGGNLYWIDPGQ